jgi:hypothetical protein
LDTIDSRLDTARQNLSQIPTLGQLLSSGVVSSNEQQRVDSLLRSNDWNDPIVNHLVRYSEFASNDLESKPITEKMDHWYLDLKKNLMVKLVQ